MTSSLSVIGCLGCLALAAAVGGRQPGSGTHPSDRLRRVVAARDPSSATDPSVPARRAAWVPWAVSATAALACALLVGGVAGVVLALAVGLGVPRWLATQEPARVRRERQQRADELPLVLDVLAACVASGATTVEAVSSVGEACRSSLGADLHRAALSLRSGAAPSEAWRDLPADLRPVGEVLDRSQRSGASSAPLLRSLADRLRAERRADRLDGARRLGVRAAAPLGLCFLPGFVVLGLLPVVIGLASQVL